MFSGVICCSLTVPAQNTATELTDAEIIFFKNKIDSLPIYWNSGKTTSNSIICKLPGHYQFYLPGDVFNFPVDAITMPERLKDSYARMHALNWRALKLYFAKDYFTADLYWQRALEIAVEKDFNFEELHMLRPSLNNDCFLSGNYPRAMRISTEGLIKAEKIKDLVQAAHFNNVIGYIYMKQGDFERSGNYFNLYLQQSRDMKDTLKEAHALYNLADLALAEKYYDTSLLYANQSMQAYQSISGRPNPGFTMQEREGYILNKMAEAAKLKGDLKEALAYGLSAIRIVSTANSVNEYDKASYYINAGDIYNRLQKPDSALVYLHKGLVISKKIFHQEYTRDAYEQLSLAFAEKKMFDSAFTYQRLLLSQNDLIAGMSNKFAMFQEQIDMQIEGERKIQKEALAKQRLLKNIILGISGFLVVILFLLYNRYRLRQKARYQESLNRHQNELFNAIAAAQDLERKRIAQDIHDSLGSILSAAKLKLSALKESQPTITGEQLEKYQVAMQLLDEASAELRNISHNIMPATLSKLGLVAALRNLINNISSHSGMQISFSTHDFTERIDEKTEMSIYRIVLELINNIVKHARALKVTVQLIRYPDYINLSVEDNGRGFDYANELNAKKGIGLGNILSRVDYLKGKINVDAAPGRGTTVIIDIPYSIS